LWTNAFPITTPLPKEQEQTSEKENPTRTQRITENKDGYVNRSRGIRKMSV
jgi:hypothetical protein